MTSIQPPLQKPPPFLRSAAAAPPGARRAGEQDFASLLLAEGAERAIPAVAPGESERSDLEAGLAHVFNAFGFFPANRNANHKPAVSPPPIAPTSTAQPAPKERGVEGAKVATLASRAMKEASSAPTLDARLQEFEPQATQGGEDLEVGHRPTDVELEVAPDGPRASSSQRIEPSLASRPRTLSLQTIATAAARQAGLSPRGIDETKPIGSARPVGTDVPESSADRLTFRIGDQAVELVGRLAALDDSDERALIEALQELLGGHGLALGAATLNGRAIELGKIRREI